MDGYKEDLERGHGRVNCYKDVIISKRIKKIGREFRK